MSIATKKRGRARLIGFADNQRDGHLRISSGENYQLFQGSDETHRLMQKKAEAFMAILHRRGLSLDNISRDECESVLEEIGMVIEQSVAP